MVPLPHAIDQDQKANAQVLARAGGGWMIEQRDMTPERLAGDLAELIDRSGRSSKRRRPARGRMGRPDAVERLADLVERVAAGAAETSGRSLHDMKMPRDIGPVHFVGIGGIGMSGIAEVMVNLGYHGAGLRPRRERQRPAPAREGHPIIDRP